MLQRLRIALAQVKVGNSSESLLNEIRQIVYSLYQSKEINKKVYNEFKISAPTWNDKFEWPDGLYVFNIKYSRLF